jgi:type II secretory pathway component GspD/PulD (secretin)
MELYMIECLASLSDICKKSFFALLLIVLFCCPVFAEEAEQPADANRPAALTERQLKLIESMGVEYSEGESFEEIMSRAREQYKQEKEERGADSTSLMEERLQITPEMIKKQEEAAKKAREEYEARRERLLRANQDKISPEAMKVLDPKGEIQKSENEEPRQDPELTVDTAQAAQVPKVEEPRSVEQTDEQGATGYSAADKISDENKELELTITLPEKVEITSLIELVGKQLGLNYIYDPAEVKGEVMLKVHNGKIKVKDTYALLESVLKFRGFVMTRRGDLVTIVPAAKATEIDPVLVDDSGEVKPGDVIVTSIFKLENITTDIAQNLLTSMNLSSNIIALPETRSIIVTGYAYRMKRIEQMLALVDVPGERRDFSYRRLEYTLASSVVDKIQALAENLGTVDVTIATGANQGNQQQRPQPVRRDSRGRIIPQPAQPQQPQGPSTDVIQSETAKYGVYLDVDDRTNRILMVGTEDDIREVNRLIDTFDVPKQDLRRIVKYKIEYADASDILTALEDLKIISTGVNSSSSRTPTNRPTPQQQGGAPQQSVATDQSGNVLLDEPQVVMIEPSNSLLVNATDEQHEKIKSIIGFIDQQPEEDQAPVKVYPLENQSVEDIRETLESVVEKVAKEKAEAEQGAAGGMGASATGKIQKTSIGKNIPNVVITGDEGTNSIVVFASRKDQEWIAELIKSLDKKRPQVLIDVTLVEITQDDKFTYDLNAVTNTVGAVEVLMVSIRMRIYKPCSI